MSGPDIVLTAGWVAEATGGRCVSGDPSRAFSGVSIDTRTIRPGELFIAIHGERFDGADFSDAALAAGAGGLVLPGGRGGLWRDCDATVIEVEDTTVALQALGHAVRRASGTKVVAITGSAGKTTTKEVTSEFLSARHQVVRTRGNFNNHIGLPLSLMDLRTRPEIAVFELGMNHAGEIRTLVHVAEPDVRVWTNVGDAHLGFFDSVDAIADAKAEIFEDADPGTLLVANADDPRIVQRLPRFAGRVTTFGMEGEADVRAVHVAERGVDGMSAEVRTPRGRFALTTPLVGRGNLANVLAATAVALEFDVPLADISERAARLRPASRRGEVVRLGRGITLVDDSYNANPTATTRALELLSGTGGSTRRIAVLGEMLELGDHARALHEQVGRAAARLGIDRLVTVGGADARAMAEAARQAGLDGAHVISFDTSDDAAAAVADIFAPGDLVLVKGSRGIRTDRVVDRLKAEFA